MTDNTLPRDPDLTALAIAIADDVRQRFAREYEERPASWQGNRYWARVEGAAAVVQALRDKLPTRSALGDDLFPRVVREGMEAAR